MFQDTLLIIKPDYLAKRKPLLLHLLQQGFFIKGQRKTNFTPELAVEFYHNRTEDVNLMFQIILLSKGNSESFIISKEHAVKELIDSMVCYFGSSSEMEERIHVTQCENQVQKEITFIFPNYIHEPIFLDQAKFCTDNPLVETTINNLYDIITNPEKEALKTWKEKLAESLILTKTDPYITNQCNHSLELNKQDIAQQTEISCLMVEEKNDNALKKMSSSDLSKTCPTLSFTTSSCLSCAGFDSAADCFQQSYQQPLEAIIKARTASLDVPSQFSASSLHTEKENNVAELNVDEQMEAEESCDDFAGQEENEGICEDDTFNNQIYIQSVNDDFINMTEPMTGNGYLSDKNSTHLLSEENVASSEKVFAASEESKRPSDDTLRVLEEAEEE